MCGLHPALSPFRRIVVLPFWDRPSGLSQVDSFMLTVAFYAIRLRSYASPALA